MNYVYMLDLKDKRLTFVTTGGKGDCLPRLINALFRVPDGLCVTTYACRKLVTENEA
jgi:phosphoenolpyruvate synthase/pyruvate phosphate dikinase